MHTVYDSIYIEYKYMQRDIHEFAICATLLRLYYTSTAVPMQMVLGE